MHNPWSFTKENHLKNSQFIGRLAQGIIFSGANNGRFQDKRKKRV
jgi:hypothetical protein